MGYGDAPAQNQQQAQGQQQQQLAEQYGQYPEDYYYQGDTFRGMMPNDQAAQVRQAIFNLDLLPTEDSDFGEWIPMMTAAIDMVARIPGVDHNIINELNRRMEDIVDRSHSQGRKKIVASKMQKLLFRLRSYVAMGDTPMLGMTGVTAMITTNTNQKQDIRMPQQQATPQSFWPWGRK